MILRTNRYGLRCVWHRCWAVRDVSLYFVKSPKPEMSVMPIGEGAVVHSYCEAHRDEAIALGFTVTRQHAPLSV